MGPRAFLLVLSLVLATPLAAGGQPQTERVWRLGVLTSLYPPDAEPAQALPGTSSVVLSDVLQGPRAQKDSCMTARRR